MTKDHKNYLMEKEILSRKIDTKSVIRQYKNGRARENIRLLFGISDELLQFIIEYYGDSELEGKREASINKWNMYKLINPLGKSKESNQSQEESVSLEEAIRRVEKDGEER